MLNNLDIDVSNALITENEYLDKISCKIIPTDNSKIRFGDTSVIGYTQVLSDGSFTFESNQVTDSLPDGYAGLVKKLDPLTMHTKGGLSIQELDKVDLEHYNNSMNVEIPTIEVPYERSINQRIGINRQETDTPGVRNPLTRLQTFKSKKVGTGYTPDNKVLAITIILFCMFVVIEGLQLNLISKRTENYIETVELLSKNLELYIEDMTSDGLEGPSKVEVAYAGNAYTLIETQDTQETRAKQEKKAQRVDKQELTGEALGLDGTNAEYQMQLSDVSKYYTKEDYKRIKELNVEYTQIESKQNRLKIISIIIIIYFLGVLSLTIYTRRNVKNLYV